jgi:hypothetical protein
MTTPWCPECGAIDSHMLRCSWWHRSRYYRDDWKPMTRLPEPAEPASPGAACTATKMTEPAQ